MTSAAESGVQGDNAAAGDYRFVAADWVRRIQRRYVRFFADARRVLDIGCGRGLFMELLQDAGIESVGVDISDEAVALCRAKGFADVDALDGRTAVRARIAGGESFDGVFCSHVIEHMAGDDVRELIGLIAAVLAPGGRLVIVTPNSANVAVITTHFWLDATHVRPYPRRLIEALIAEAGLDLIASFDDRATREAIGGWRGLARLPAELARVGISRLLPLDAVVVARKPEVRA